MKKRKKPQIFLHAISIIYVISCIIPFIIIFSASLTHPLELSERGFGLWPNRVDTSAYRVIFEHPDTIIRSYGVTIITTVLTVFFGLFFMSMAAYTLSRKNCSFRRLLSFFFFFTMLFSGGLVPSYIWITQYLHLQDTIWVMIIPSLVNVFHIIMIRTFFQKLPESLYESAKIDGSSEFRIYFQIALPLSVPVLATVAFFNTMGKWNDWSTALYFINVQKLYPLQYLLYKIQKDIQTLLIAMDFNTSGMGGIDIKDIPGENLLMAMAIVAIGPMLVIFPLFQKYFVSGLTVGSVKG